MDAIMKTINAQLEDLNFELIQHKLNVLEYTKRALIKSLRRLDKLKEIHAPRSIIDGEFRLFSRLMSRFVRLERWASAPASEDFVNTVANGFGVH